MVLHLYTGAYDHCSIMLEYCVLKSDDFKLGTTEEREHVTFIFPDLVHLMQYFFFLGQSNLPANFMI